MENLIVIKTDKHLNTNIYTDLAKATKSTVVRLPMTCTITTGEEAIAELKRYKDVIDKFLE